MSGTLTIFGIIITLPNVYVSVLDARSIYGEEHRKFQSSSVSPCGQFIANWDFELNPVIGGGFEYLPPTGWQSCCRHTAVVSTHCGPWGGGVAAPSGKYYLAIQGHGYLEQTVAVPSTLSGSILTLQFYLSKRSDSDSYGLASTSVNVSINRVVLQTIALTSSFTHYSLSTPPATSTMTVRFDDSSPTTYDDISFLMDEVTLSLADCTAAPSRSPTGAHKI
jgi:hypothetical protein